MDQASKTIKTDLEASPELDAIIDGRFYWELAPKSAVVPLLTYRIRENKRPTKDKGGNYDLKVYCFAETLSDAAELSEVAKQVLNDANYRYQYGESGYTDTETPEGYIELNFNFNL